MKLIGSRIGPIHVLPEIVVTAIPSDSVKREIEKAKKKFVKSAAAPRTSSSAATGKGQKRPKLKARRGKA